MVRLPGKDPALLGISREAERVATAAAARLGIAPELAAGDDSCLVTRYVESTPVDADQLRAAPEQVARSLRTFHDSDARLPVRFWVPDLLDSYAAIVRALRAMRLALTDPLTGLGNHRHFHERMREELARATERGTSLSLRS